MFPRDQKAHLSKAEAWPRAPKLGADVAMRLRIGSAHRGTSCPTSQTPSKQRKSGSKPPHPPMDTSAPEKHEWQLKAVTSSPGLHLNWAHLRGRWCCTGCWTWELRRNSAWGVTAHTLNSATPSCGETGVHRGMVQPPCHANQPHVLSWVRARRGWTAEGTRRLQHTPMRGLCASTVQNKNPGPHGSTGLSHRVRLSQLQPGAGRWRKQMAQQKPALCP